MGVAALYAFVLHELVPPRVPDALLLTVEGAMAVVFAAVLVALTGGVASPFFVALPLIVVGAATVVTPGMALALTAGAALAYLVAVLAPAPALDEASLATIAVNLTALGLTGYIGMAIGREQRRARLETSRLASVDPLTGLRTRPYLFGALERELARSQRTGRAFCLLMIDMDDLKGINDRLGHLVGDRALRLVGDVDPRAHPADRHGRPVRGRRVRRAAPRDRFHGRLDPRGEDPPGRGLGRDPRRRSASCRRASRWGS